MPFSLVTGPYCTNCVNAPYGVRRVEPDGSGSSGILFLGDSPWLSEIAIGRNFAGASGGLLNRLLKERLNIERSTLTVANTMCCKPPHLDWTDHPERYPDAQEAIKHCSPYLNDLIKQRKPKVIVAMGNVALNRVAGVIGLENRHSYVHETAFGIPAVPTFHPSFILQEGNSRYSSAFMFAVRRAQEIAKGAYKPTHLDLHENPSPEGLIRYLGSGPIPELMIDIETPESGKLDEESAEDDASYNIIRAGLSTGLGHGASVSWTDAYPEIVLDAISRAKTVMFWNKNYDLPRLVAAGAKVKGQIIDAMWAWHFLQSDLPKALGFVAPFFYAGPAWKHLNHSHPAFYNCMDAAVQMLCLYGIRDALKRENRWDRFIKHCVDTDPILVRMGNKGVIVDKEQQQAFMGRLKEEVVVTNAKLQEAVSAVVKPVKEWKKPPKPKELKNPTEWLPPWDKDLALRDVSDAKFRILPAPADKPNSVVKYINEAGVPTITSGVAVWTKQLPFNPSSSDQLIALMRHLGLKVPKKRGTDSNTTEAKYLKRYGEKHPVFRLVTDCRERNKLITTYGWVLDELGRVHTVYGFHASTWRKTSRKVNLQNIPKRSDLAKEFRKMLIAAPGCVFMAADAAAIEAVLVGYAANSPSYISLAKAGVHGWLTSHVVGKPIDWQLPFDELHRQCVAMKRAYPVVYEGSKRGIHGSNYLLSPYGLHDEYPEYFPTERAAREMQDLYFSLPPGQEVRKWHSKVLNEAHLKTVLRNHFDYQHRFYEVFKYDSRKKAQVLGHDAKRAVAFIPQSDASAIQTEVLLRLAAYPDILDWLRLIIHDEVVLEIPEEAVDYCGQIVYTEMLRPMRELGGLTIGAEVKVGRNLAEMSEWTPKQIAA